MKRLSVTLLTLLCLLFTPFFVVPVYAQGATVRIEGLRGKAQLYGLLVDWLGRSGYSPVESDRPALYRCRFTGLDQKQRAGGIRGGGRGFSASHQNRGWQVRANFVLSYVPTGEIFYTSSTTSVSGAVASHTTRLRVDRYSVELQGQGVTKDDALADFFGKLPLVPPPIMPSHELNVTPPYGTAPTSPVAATSTIWIDLMTDGRQVSINGPAGTRLLMRVFLLNPDGTRAGLRLSFSRTIPKRGTLLLPNDVREPREVDFYLDGQPTLIKTILLRPF